MNKKGFLKSAMLVTVLAGIVCVSGCKVEVLPTREQQKEADAKKHPNRANSTAALITPGPNTDNAAAVIATCGPAASDEMVNVNDKLDVGNVRRLVYRGSREVTLDFIPLQANAGNGYGTSSNTVWRFNEARVDNQTLLTAANIRVYLPCAANALAKEF